MANDQSGSGASRLPGLANVLVPDARFGGARYILRRVLGRGGVAEVWLARDVKLEQEVALKFLPASVFQHGDIVERLKVEANRTLTLAHPNIARTYEFVQDPRAAAVSGEFVDGWSLAALRVDKPGKRFHLDEITPWIRQVCAALTYAHDEMNILHLDLKTSNLLLNSRVEIKVTDFLFARALQSVASPTELKLAADALGFMSPQQAFGETPSVLDDVYGLGATLFDLLTGTPPFYKGQVLAQVCERPAQRMAERLAELGIKDTIPIVVEDTVAQCLAKEPAKRPQNIDAVLRLLERSDVPVVVESPAPKTVEAPPVTELPPPPPVEEVSKEMEVAEPAAVSDPAAPVEPVPEPTPAIPRKPISALLTFGILAFLALLSLLWLGHAKKHAKPTLPAGSVDAGFMPGTNADHEVRAVLEQPDRNIVIGGMFNYFGEGGGHGLARLKPDGSLDESFTATTGGDVYTLARQGDGKLIVGGAFQTINDRPCRRIARLNADGSLDESFTANAGVNDDVRAVLIQADGKIVVAGNFRQAVGHRLARIARFNADGTFDDTFNPGSGAPAVVWSLVGLADGKILVAGNFTTFDGKRCGRMVRLNPNGSVDETFNLPTKVNGQIFAVAVQSDGKIVVGGDFTQIGDEDRRHVGRLNPDGSLDLSFNPGAGPDKGIRCLAIQSDGRILIGGVFESTHGVARGRIARLNADGSLDTTFDPGEGANEVIRAILPLSDGRIMVAGGFTKFADKPNVRLTRLNGGS